MKRLLLLVMILNSYLVFSQDIPEKLLLSSKSFSENQSLYPIYRIDLIVFSHKQINERDKQEQFPQLDGFIYTPDLLKLLDTPNLLVKKQAIKVGLTPSTQVIQSIDLNPKQTPVNLEEVDSETKQGQELNRYSKYKFGSLTTKNVNESFTSFGSVGI